MFDTLYYIFSSIIITAALLFTFSRNILNSAFSLLLVLLGACGVYTLLNSELFAMVNILAITGISLILLIFTPHLKKISEGEKTKLPPVHFISLIILSLLTAIVSSLLASTRWRLFEINFELNSFSMVFSKYFPLILTIVLILSVIIVSSGYILKKPAKSHR